jgi:YaiO family outer membrane protein
MALAGGMASAVRAQEAAPLRMVEIVHTDSRLTGPYQDGRLEQLRGTWGFAGGHVLRAEAVDERRFGESGGIGGIGYTHVLSPQWNVSGALAAGHGGPIWPNRRVDVDVARAWGASLAFVTRVGWYDARYQAGRSDRGWRLSAAAYLPGGVVVEAGTILNASQPGHVRSRMPFVAVTAGREGQHYVSLRVADGREAYQAVGDQRQIADFASRSVTVAGRLWLAPTWGVSAQAEHYVNRSSGGYERVSIGAGVFHQW